MNLSSRSGVKGLSNTYGRSQALLSFISVGRELRNRPPCVASSTETPFWPNITYKHLQDISCIQFHDSTVYDNVFINAGLKLISKCL